MCVARWCSKVTNTPPHNTQVVGLWGLVDLDFIFSTKFIPPPPAVAPQPRSMSAVVTRFEMITDTPDLLETHVCFLSGTDYLATPHASFGPELTYATLATLADGTWLFAKYSGNDPINWPVGYYACNKATNAAGEVGIEFKAYYTTLGRAFLSF